MKKLVATLAILVAAATVGLKYHARQIAEEAKSKLEQAKAEHEIAVADSDQITQGIKNYWELKNRTVALENDKMQLMNDLLTYDIAGLTGARPDGTGSAQQPDICRGMDRFPAGAGSATERYHRQQAKLGRIRNNGS